MEKEGGEDIERQTSASVPRDEIVAFLSAGTLSLWEMQVKGRKRWLSDRMNESTN